MNGRLLIGLLFLATTSCGGDFPRDPNGTIERVRSQRAFAVGLVAPVEQAGRQKVEALLHRVGKATGASPQLSQGQAEPLLKQLEDGHIDLVIGRFEKKSPWAHRVTIGPPLRIEMQGKTEVHLAPVMRNGENAWIAVVEKAARDAAPGLE
jgi:hypothetical protein